MILLDTHVLLWWALDPAKLSETARRKLAEVEEVGGFASSISIWELGIKVKRDQLRMPISVTEFARRLERSSRVELLPVDTTIWLRSLGLDWEHRDPADRVIVASAQLKGVPLLTKDQLIHRFAEVECIW